MRVARPYPDSVAPKPPSTIIEPVPVPLVLAETEEERRRQREADVRREGRIRLRDRIAAGRGGP